MTKQLRDVQKLLETEFKVLNKLENLKISNSS